MSFLCTAPDFECGTLAELNGTLIHANNKDNLEHNVQTPLYPSIQFETLAPTTPDYINQEPTSVNVLENIYNDIKSSVQQQFKQSLPLFESTAVYTQAKKIYDYVYSHYLKTPDYILEHPTFQQNELIRCIAWHPHLEILAVAAKDNQVYMYQKSDDWQCQVLKHEKMKDITCMEWKSKSTGTLAVGCKEGVCVWTLEKAPVGDHIQYHPLATMKHLAHPDHKVVGSLAWDPTPGSHLLAVVSPLSNTLVIHDLSLNRTIPLKRYGKGNVLLRWSPSGEWLFEGGAADQSRLWDTRTWDSRQIINPPGLWVQAACWSPDNRTLVYSMAGKNEIHALFLSGTDVKSNLFGFEISSTPSTTVETESGNKTTVGGVIRDIAIDQRNGQRLAVAYENSDLISLYSLKKVSPLNVRQDPMIYPIGYIRGLESSALKGDARPINISFSSTFKGGAILATTWNNGFITFTTHSFLTEQEIQKRFI